MSHTHNHSCGKDCDHSDSAERGIEYSLYKKIDMNNLVCFNEAEENSGRNIFRPWEERLRTDKMVESDADEELLINIPFSGLVKLKGVIVIGGDEDSHPSCMRLFKNRPHMSFEDATSLEADQVFEMTKDTTGILEYAPKIVKFSSIYHLSIHFSRNFGADNTRIYYIGLKGEFSEVPRQGLAICTYESAPNPADHKIESINTASNLIQ